MHDGDGAAGLRGAEEGYCRLLDDWDRAVYAWNLQVAQKRHGELSDFLLQLDRHSRAQLENKVDLPGWTARRLWRLHKRWEALVLHEGSWCGWCSRLQGLGKQVSREQLLSAASDLAYRQAPSAKQRETLWCFCAGIGPAGTAAPLATATRPYKDQPLGDIRLDVDRTPNLAKGQDDELVNILVSHCAQRVCEKGSAGELHRHYVQGMHLLAACPLWAGLPEHWAFAVFEFVLNNLCAGYYVDSAFDAFQRDVRVAEKLIAERLPKLAKALEIAGVSTMTLAFDPLLCLFTRHVQLEAVLRLWDVLLVEGDAAIFAVLLALLEPLVPRDAEASAPDNSLDIHFAERLQELAATADAEQLLDRAKDYLDGGLVNVPLRHRVPELRKSVMAPRSGHAGRRQGQGLRPRGLGAEDVGPTSKHRGRSPGLRPRGRSFEDGDMLDDMFAQAKSWLLGDATSASSSRAAARGARGGRGCAGTGSDGEGSEASSGPSSPASGSAAEGAAGVARDFCIVDLGGRGQTVNSEFVVGALPGSVHEALATRPMEVTMKLPEDYRAGQPIVIRGPHGPMRVQAPIGAQPGAAMRHRLVPSPDFEMRVPPGAGPGKEVKFLREDGVQLSVTVPEGLRPGDVFGVMPPAAMVLVPAGVEPGDVVVFQHPFFQHPLAPRWCQATVPPGMRANRYFAARLPPPESPDLDTDSRGSWLSESSWLSSWLEAAVRL